MKEVKSACELVRLQIDDYLDEEMGPTVKEGFLAHTEGCQDCQKELCYAEALYQSVLSLPELDCSDEAMEPVDRLIRPRPRNPGMMDWLRRTFLPGPSGAWLSPALAACLMVSVGLVLGLGLNEALRGGGEVTTIAGEQYTEEEIVRAMRDMEVAISYLNEISQRTEDMIENRFFLEQLQESVNASLNTLGVDRDSQNAPNGPI